MPDMSFFSCCAIAMGLDLPAGYKDNVKITDTMKIVKAKIRIHVATGDLLMIRTDFLYPSKKEYVSYFVDLYFT